MAQGYVKATDLPQAIPLFPLPGAILLPRGQLPLNVFEPRYLNMVDDAMGGDRLIGMIQPAGGAPDRPALAPVGCAGRITGFAETSDGRYLITLTGVCRFRLVSELSVRSPYRQARADFAAFETDLNAPATDDDPFPRPSLFDALRAYLERRALDIDWNAADGAPAEALINSLSMALPFEPPEKQALIEAADLTSRAEVLTTLLRIDAAEPPDAEDTPIQ